jgi:dolichol-phosphate mannosyltransferase
MTAGPRLTVVIPARGEGGRICAVLDQVLDVTRLPCEILVVVDRADDCTAAVVRAYAATQPAVSCLVNSYGPGPAQAIRYGMDAARAGVLVVMMADGSDDSTQVEELVTLVERGAVIAAASRYMPGGQQVGGHAVKQLLARAAGLSLRLLARTGTCDPTNSFKAYSADFVRSAGVQSRRGFTVSIELTAKARRMRLPVAEIPTRWTERPDGTSSFRLAAWLPAYLRWYLYCFGPRRRRSQGGQLSGARA